jgi:diketogulonate reductase-like aldo/keto reductase
MQNNVHGSSVATLAETDVVLRSGDRMPLLGFGTYQIPDSDEGYKAIETALETGYRLLDCASFYKNEHVVGKVIARRERESLFIVSKVWNDAIFLGPSAVRESCLKSIADLRCKYLDLFLIHWPVPGKHVDAFKELIKLKREGYVRNIGVSNYTIEDFEELCQAGVAEVPVVNQIEINPFLYRKRTIDFFRQRGVVVMSFRGLKNAQVFDNAILINVARHLNVTVPQLLGRWLVQQGFCHIPKSIHPSRIQENASIWHFNIGPDDMENVKSLMTEHSLGVFHEHYLNRIVRDTPLPVPKDRIITCD